MSLFEKMKAAFAQAETERVERAAQLHELTGEELEIVAGGKEAIGWS